MHRSDRLGTLLLLAAACRPPLPADLVLRNGNVYTGHEATPHAEAVAIQGDTIVFVGSNAEAARYGGPNAREVDLRGATVFAGWADAHAHLSEIGAREMGIDDLASLTEAQQDSTLVIGARRMVELGWTQVHDVGGTWAEVERIRRLSRAGLLKLRIYKSISGPGPEADSLLTRGPGERELGGRLAVRALSMVLDGSLESRAAALLDPYADDPSAIGVVTADTAAVRATLLRAIHRGVQVQLEAAGDAANRLALDLVKQAHRAYPWRDHERPFRMRWRIEHADLVDAADVFRFRVLELMPSVQPAHGVGALAWAAERLGARRLKGAYAWRTFAELGIPVAGGSDAPAERGDPLREFYAAVHRRDPQGFSGPDSLWHPEEALTRGQALNLFTRYAAWAGFDDDVRGEIHPGRWADLTVFDADLMKVPERDILAARARMTVIGGEIVYSSPDRGAPASRAGPAHR
jgi:predicted amidohydrolase YtcJ